MDPTLACDQHRLLCAERSALGTKLVGPGSWESAALYNQWLHSNHAYSSTALFALVGICEQDSVPRLVRTNRTGEARRAWLTDTMTVAAQSKIKLAITKIESAASTLHLRGLSEDEKTVVERRQTSVEGQPQRPAL